MCVCCAAAGGVREGRAGHRAVLHREGRAAGQGRLRVLRQVQRGRRRHPLAERGTVHTSTYTTLQYIHTIHYSLTRCY